MKKKHSGNKLKSIFLEAGMSSQIKLKKATIMQNAPQQKGGEWRGGGESKIASR